MHRCNASVVEQAQWNWLDYMRACGDECAAYLMPSLDKYNMRDTIYECYKVFNKANEHMFEQSSVKYRLALNNNKKKRF